MKDKLMILICRILNWIGVPVVMRRTAVRIIQPGDTIDRYELGDIYLVVDRE